MVVKVKCLLYNLITIKNQDNNSYYKTIPPLIEKYIGKEKIFMETDNDIVEVDLRSLLHALIRKIWIVILAGILGAAVIGLTNIYLITPYYTSTSKIYIINRQDESRTTYSDLQTGTQITQDFMILITSRPVMEKVVEDSGIDITPGELAGKISLINPEGTRILEISVTDIDPVRAKKLADAVADTSAEQIVNIMEIQKVNVVEYGIIPGAPTGQNIPRSFVMGGLIGAVFAASLIIAIHMLNNNIKSEEDIEIHLGITTLGMIPVEDSLNLKGLKIRHMRKKAALATAKMRYGSFS